MKNYFLILPVLMITANPIPKRAQQKMKDSFTFS